MHLGTDAGGPSELLAGSRVGNCYTRTACSADVAVRLAVLTTHRTVHLGRSGHGVKLRQDSTESTS